MTHKNFLLFRGLSLPFLDWCPLKNWQLYSLLCLPGSPPDGFASYTSHYGFDLHVPSNYSATAPHSSALAWKIPGMEEPGGLQSMGLLRVGHSWSDLATAAATNEAEHLFVCCLPLIHLLWQNVCPNLLPIFHWVVCLITKRWASFIQSTHKLSVGRTFGKYFSPYFFFLCLFLFLSRGFLPQRKLQVGAVLKSRRRSAPWGQASEMQRPGLQDGVPWLTDLTPGQGRWRANQHPPPRALPGSQAPGAGTLTATWCTSARARGPSPGMWAPSSLTRGQTRSSCRGGEESSYYWTPGNCH